MTQTGDSIRRRTSCNERRTSRVFGVVVGRSGGGIIKGARGETDRDLLRARDAPQFPADLLPNLRAAPVVRFAHDCGDTAALRRLPRIKSDDRRRK